MKYNKWTLGQVEAVFNKLGGDDGVRRFLAGELVVKPFHPKFKVFKTIKLGTGSKNADDFRKAIEDRGMKIGDCWWAINILGKPEFTVATGETEVDLVKVTAAELGFKNSVRRDQIYDRAKELGLELCPPEVGPQLRLQYKDQPNGEWIHIGMEPIRDSIGDLDMFDVGRDDYGQWLGSDNGGPGCIWSAASQWVFVLPRKCQ
jgi:hypothetical protein